MQTIDKLGIPKKELEKFTNAAESFKGTAHFVFPFSLIDLRSRDDHFKNATKAKIAAYLAVIHTLFPEATVEFLIGDSLRSNNSDTKTIPLMEQWSTLLNLPLTELDVQTKTFKTSYTVQHAFDGDYPPKWNITLSSWEQYTDPVSALMDEVYLNLIAITEQNTANIALPTLIDDQRLYQCQGFSDIKAHFDAQFCELLGLKEYSLSTHADFVGMIEGIGRVTAHHLKKTHNLPSLPANSQIDKKEMILKSLPDLKQAVDEYIDAYAYNLEELLVILHMSKNKKQDLLWMIYPSGVCDVPDYHPIRKMNALFHLAKLKAYFHTGSGFQFPYKDHKMQNSSNGGSQTMLKNQTGVEHHEEGQSSNGSPQNIPAAKAANASHLTLSTLPPNVENAMIIDGTSPSVSSGSSVKSDDGDSCQFELEKHPSEFDNRHILQQENLRRDAQTLQEEIKLLRAQKATLQEQAQLVLSKNPGDLSQLFALTKPTLADFEKRENHLLHSYQQVMLRLQQLQSTQQSGQSDRKSYLQAAQSAASKRPITQIYRNMRNSALPPPAPSLMSTQSSTSTQTSPPARSQSEDMASSSSFSHTN